VLCYTVLCTCITTTTKQDLVAKCERVLSTHALDDEGNVAVLADFAARYTLQRLARQCFELQQPYSRELSGTGS
jgi:hypothetical protein